MRKHTDLQNVLQFFLTRIVIGIAVVAGLVFFSEWGWKLALERSQISSMLKSIITAFSDSILALLGYICLYRIYEKRKITELSISSFLSYSSLGFVAGFILQALFILFIYISGNFNIVSINPAYYLLPAFATSLTAGFVSEILIRGIVFRITEEKLGTVVSIVIFTILFALFHFNVNGATSISIIATALQAGFLLSAAYVYTRNLWFTIFLHFAWDFAEPGIFGAINPGNSIDQSLISSKITGSYLLTGGPMGPQNSIQAAIICFSAGLLFLWIAYEKKHFIEPFRRKTEST